jgi:iron complex outermembrane receptor protein
MQMIRLLLFLFIWGNGANAQLTIQGNIQSVFGDPLKDVYVQFNEFSTLTNSKGNFEIQLPKTGFYQIYMKADFYESISQEINLTKNETLNFVLKPEVIQLNSTVIEHKHETKIQNKEMVNQAFLSKEYSGSLAKTLEKIPGIQAMEIGSGTAKPVIRGLGFNRILVSENGLKQEGQQWGADHGLEMSPWGIEEVEIIKGAGTLEYGGDAMGGVIAIQNNQKPLRNSFSGNFTLLGRSVNQAMGSALSVQQRKDQFYWKLAASYTDFADYKIPTHQITYLTRQIPIYNEELKNTAGNEFSNSIQLGFIDQDFQNIFHFSYYAQKMGFFPGAHGVPDLTRVEDDGDRRNIEFPYQNVQHLKFNNESTIKWGKNALVFLMGFQNNHRQEWSYFHTHYGNAHHPPLVDPDLELDFNLSTYDAQIKFQQKFSKNYETNWGLQTQFQENNIQGYSFLMPEYSKQNYAFYATQDWKINPKWMLNFGIRLDYTHLKSEAFFDSYLNEFLLNNGHSTHSAQELAQRSMEVKKEYWNFNYSIGTLFQTDSHLDFNLNLTSNFRVPNAIELASDGIHHGSFRHEKGNPNLNPEKGWSADFKITYHPKDWNIEINPYLYYFQNYIFLEPSVLFSPLPHGGQIYQYNQTEALITGAELKVEKKFWNRLNGFLSLEYLYNQQMGKSHQTYPLPFSPPFHIFNEWRLDLIQKGKILKNLSVSANFKHAMKQNRVARNEEITDAYTIFGAGIQSDFRINKFQAELILNAQNITNEKYFNHMSYYRALEIPEMGRNIQFILRFPF